jgi:hypothetical protein
MLVQAVTRKSTTVDGIRFGDIIVSGAYYGVLEESGGFYHIEMLNGTRGWFFKDGFKEVPQ